jgi:predicted histone-like DNA-binding protein
MHLNYKIVSTFSPGEGKEGRKLWFPKLTGSTQVNLNEIADLLSKRTTAHGADVILIVNALVDLIPELLTSGHTVKLDELGTFRLHAKVAASDSREAVSKRNIRELRISFIPHKGMKKKLKNAKIEIDS